MTALAPAATPTMTIGAEDVHIWTASLDASLSDLGRLRRLLSEDELERADRFVFELDRARFVVGRALLRTLLGRYLGEHPSTLSFSYTKYGKPELNPAGEIRFNLSHSGGSALFAVCLGYEIGVDVERMQPGISRDRVPEHFFSQSEVTELRRLPAEKQDAAFLACWTRKEAYIKGRGEGLSLTLADFDVSLSPGEKPALLRTAWSPSEPREWRICDVSTSWPGHVAAVAVRSERIQLTTRNLRQQSETPRVRGRTERSRT